MNRRLPSVMASLLVASGYARTNFFRFAPLRRVGWFATPPPRYQAPLGTAPPRSSASRTSSPVGDTLHQPWSPGIVTGAGIPPMDRFIHIAAFHRIVVH